MLSTGRPSCYLKLGPVVTLGRGSLRLQLDSGLLPRSDRHPRLDLVGGSHAIFVLALEPFDDAVADVVAGEGLLTDACRGQWRRRARLPFLRANPS